MADKEEIKTLEELEEKGRILRVSGRVLSALWRDYRPYEASVFPVPWDLISWCSSFFA